MKSTPISKKSKEKPQKFVYLYALYLGIDSGKLSMSMIKYGFDIFLTNGELAAQAMHEWITSPVGAAITILGTISFIGFALLANKLDREDKNPFKRYIATLWPYIRDSLKSLRNTLRGVSSTLTLLYLVDLQDLRHLIIPLGLSLGILSVLNRIWIRYKSNQQNKMLEKNISLLDEIEGFNELTWEQIDDFRKKISKQSKQFIALSLFSSVLSGLIDGINPYIGALAVGTMMPPILVVITVFCCIYFLATLTMRIYDEINMQHRLYVAQKNVELILLEKEIDFLVIRLSRLSESITLVPDNNGLVDEYFTLCDYLNYKLWEHEKESAELSLMNTDIPIFFKGIKNGLNIYKYIMLTISTCLFLSPIKISPVSPINRAALGLSALGGGVIYSSSTSKKIRSQQENQFNTRISSTPFLCHENNETKESQDISVREGEKQCKLALGKRIRFFPLVGESECSSVPGKETNKGLNVGFF